MFRISAPITAFLLATPAFAGGYVAPPVAPPPVIVPVDQDWTGLYIGGQIDYIANSESFTDDMFLVSYDGYLAGVFAGYRYDFGNIVVGGEIDYMIGVQEVDEVAPNVFLTQNEVDTRLLRIGGEVGYDLGDALIYATAGYAHLTLDFDFSPNESDGIFYGLGMDYRVSESVVVGAEVLMHEFSDFPTATALNHEILTVGLNVAFTF